MNGPLPNCRCRLWTTPNQILRRPQLSHFGFIALSQSSQHAVRISREYKVVFVRLVICCTLKTLPDQKGIRGNVIKLPEQISSCQLCTCSATWIYGEEMVSPEIQIHSDGATVNYLPIFFLRQNNRKKIYPVARQPNKKIS